MPGLRYGIVQGACSIMGGVHVDFILCNFANKRVHMGVLKSSSTRTADAAEHLLVIDIEAKSTAAIEMPMHVGVGGRDVGNELHWNQCPAVE